MSIVQIHFSMISNLIEWWRICHEKVDFYVTVRPEERDEKGFLGYKWRGLVYEKRNHRNEFIPIESCKLYRSPRKAIQETRENYYNLKAMLGDEDED